MPLLQCWCIASFRSHLFTRRDPYDWELPQCEFIPLEFVLVFLYELNGSIGPNDRSDLELGPELEWNRLLIAVVPRSNLTRDGRIG